MINYFYEFESEGKVYGMTAFNEDLFTQDYPGGLTTNYDSWFTNQKITQFNSHGIFPFTLDNKNKFLDSIKNNKNIIIFAVIDTITFTHVGNISLQEINYINRTAELAIIMDSEYHGKGIGTEAALLTLHHGFHKMNLNKIYTGTADVNRGMIRIAEHCGMKQEGILRKEIYADGDYRDIIRFGILREEFLKNE